MSRRLVASVLLATVFVASPPAHARGNPGAVERARAFDQAGVKAYAEGRYREAIVLFEEAFFEGGPAYELWNEAKCWLRLDDGPQAAKALRRYLAEPSLPADEKAEAERLLDEIQHRPSSVTVATTPPGATVRIDDKLVGVSPLTTSLSPGKHELRLEHPTSRHVLDQRRRRRRSGGRARHRHGPSGEAARLPRRSQSGLPCGAGASS